MTGHTIATPGTTRSAARPSALTASRAARELGLRRAEFDLAVHLGRIRTLSETARAHEPPGSAATRRRVAREEIDRIRATEGFPDTLREDISTVSAPRGAQLMGISIARFTRLARLGLLVPVRFYLNRYRAVVWLYLTEELRTFAALKANEPLLTARLPETLRSQIETGTDLRARNWRGRQHGFLLRLTEDPWARAAVTASPLDADEVEDVVADPRERSYLARLRPERPDQNSPGSLASQVVGGLMTAEEPDEIEWFRSSLALSLTDARKARPAPDLQPATASTTGEAGGSPTPTPPQGDTRASETAHHIPVARPKGLLARLRRSHR
ncbi:DUF6397 family protein [Streptomyces sp. TS71-3]|uniref:DUF6397 family protein n=1 Tax=Streptomyces sp. TS71-3 TaxID=2733862 RepID=UPI001B2B5772|nr:DUF6397 family protein [Streptomyces sp. TS71-3]GHJ42204.1 hypothetical protein Sm713_78130 [Streptomyces sp. TS71-3]